MGGDHGEGTGWGLRKGWASYPESGKAGGKGAALGGAGLKRLN